MRAIRDNRYIENGSGAHGFLALVPIVDFSVVQAQIDAILGRLVQLEEDNAAPPRR